MVRGSVRRSRVRLAPLALVVGIASTAVLGLSAVGTVSGLSASITNTNNTTGTASLTMRETSSDGGTICNSTDGTGGISTNAYDCSTINKYGGTAGPGLVPGGPAVATTVRIFNSGSSTPSGFTLAPQTCNQSTPGSGTGTATDLCSKINLTVMCTPPGGTAVSVYSGTLAAFSGSISIPGKSAGCVPAAGGAVPVPFTFSVSLDSGAGNTYQNLTVTQPMTWQFNS